MFDFDPSLKGALVGVGVGFALSVPVGPVNLTIINEGARLGLRWGLMIGFGATLMEVIYCAIAFTGLASFFDGKVVKAIIELASFVFMLYLGIRFMTMRAVPQVKPMHGKLQEKLNASSAFGTGFVRVLWNPGVFLFWIFLAALFRAHDWVEPGFKAAVWCVAGVAVGTSLWFGGLSYAVSLGHRKFSEKTLLRIEKGSGLCLFALAFGQGVHIVWQMTHHKF